MKKRFLILLLAVIMAFSCQIQVLAEEHEPVTINFYSVAATNGANEQIVADFMAKYPWITVNRVELPETSGDKLAMLSTVFQAQDTSIDVTMVDVVWPGIFSAAGWLEPLNDVYTENELSEFFPDIMDICYSDGNLYCLPAYLSVGSMYYRKDLLEKYGFEPAKTVDELIEQCKTVQAGEENIYGYSSAWREYEALTCCVLEFMWSHGADVSDENGACTLDTPMAVEGLSAMKKMLDAEIVAPGTLGFNWSDARSLFLSGNLLYLKGWPNTYSSIQNPELSAVVDKVGVIGSPSNNPDELGWNCNGGFYVGVSAFSENKEAAKLFAKYYSSHEAMLTNALKFSQLPARPSVYQDPTFLSEIPEMTQFLTLADHCKNRPASAYYEEISAAIRQATAQVLAGTIDAETACKEMTEAVQKIMER